MCISLFTLFRFSKILGELAPLIVLFWQHSYKYRTNVKQSHELTHYPTAVLKHAANLTSFQIHSKGSPASAANLDHQPIPVSSIFPVKGMTWMAVGCTSHIISFSCQTELRIVWRGYHILLRTALLQEECGYAETGKEFRLPKRVQSGKEAGKHIHTLTFQWVMFKWFVTIQLKVNQTSSLCLLSWCKLRVKFWSVTKKRHEI